VILRYHRAANFGDALNPWIWREVAGDLLDDGSSDVLVGIGSLLGFDFDPEADKYVLTTGFGGGDPENYGTAPVLDESWHVLAVRGPLTAEALGLPRSRAVTDGAALVRHLRPELPEGPPLDCGWMPHVASLEFVDAEALAARNGLHFLDPRRDPWTLMGEMARCRKIVTEALHGAIVADALRVPWVPLKQFRQVNEFKWRDWLQSMELDAVRLHEAPEDFSDDMLRRIADHKLGPAGVGPLPPLVAKAYGAWQGLRVRPRVDAVFRRLRETDGHLSRDGVLEDRCARILELVEDLRRSRRP